MSWSIDDVVWMAGEFSRPPLSKQQLANLRARLENAARGPSGSGASPAEDPRPRGARQEVDTASSTAA